MAVGRNGAPYGSSGSTRNPGGPSSPGRVGPSTGGPAGGGPAFTNPISGGGGHDEFNIRLLLSCAIGGAVGTALAMLLIRQLYESIPNIILYGIVMAVISLGVLLGAVTTTNMYGESFPKTIAVAILGTAIMFAAAALFEFVYEIKVEPKQKEEPAVEQVVSVPVDYIFCIDDSTSMDWNDPQNLRDSALADLLDQISPSSRVGILRYNEGLKSGESVGPAPLDENQKQLLRGVLQNHKSGGNTNFKAPLQEALDEYIKADETGRKPIVVLLTDGEDDSLDVQHWVDEYNKNGITLCGIFLGKDSSNYLETMKTLCEGTNGFVVNAKDANQLLSAYGTIVEETATTEPVEEPEYIRFLAGPREGTDKKNVLSIVERLLFFGLLGLLLGGAIRIMLGEMLFKQIFIGGGLGLLAGAIVEFGYMLGLGSISRVGYLLYIIVIANYSILDSYVGAKWATSGGGGAYSGTGAKGGSIGQGFDKQNGRRIN